jgi:hypothetical protein
VNGDTTRETRYGRLRRRRYLPQNQEQRGAGRDASVRGATRVPQYGWTSSPCFRASAAAAAAAIGLGERWITRIGVDYDGATHLVIGFGARF